MELVNAAVLIVFNLVVLGLLIWFVGSIALRFVGWGWIIFGLAVALNGAATGSATVGTYALAAFNLALGLFFWFCGHVLYAIRHRRWKSAVLHRADRKTRRLLAALSSRRLAIARDDTPSQSGFRHSPRRG